MTSRILPKSTNVAATNSRLPPTIPRPQKASLACMECRKRRTRCRGGMPCNSCRQNSKDCVMDKESDGRRKLFSKRKIESLEKDRALLIRLVEKVRDSDQKDLNETIETIRGGASLTTLESHLLDHGSIDLTCGTPVTRDETIADNRHDWTANDRYNYLDVANIIE